MITKGFCVIIGIVLSIFVMGLSHGKVYSKADVRCMSGDFDVELEGVTGHALNSQGMAITHSDGLLYITGRCVAILTP